MDAHFYIPMILGIVWATFSSLIGIGILIEDWRSDPYLKKSIFHYYKYRLWNDNPEWQVRCTSVAFFSLFWTVLFAVVFVGYAIQGYYGLFRSSLSSVKGVLSMKRRMVAVMLTLFLGGDLLPTLGYQPQIFNRMVAWWNAPPSPPSPEAQKLITSLENADGWATSSEGGFLQKGEVKIKPCTFSADVYVGGMPCTGQFSASDLRALNKASSLCTRKLTTRAMDAQVSQ